MLHLRQGKFTSNGGKSQTSYLTLCAYFSQYQTSFTLNKKVHTYKFIIIQLKTLSLSKVLSGRSATQRDTLTGNSMQCSDLRRDQGAYIVLCLNPCHTDRVKTQCGVSCPT